MDRFVFNFIQTHPLLSIIVGLVLIPSSISIVMALIYGLGLYVGPIAQYFLESFEKAETHLKEMSATLSKKICVIGALISYVVLIIFTLMTGLQLFTLGIAEQIQRTGIIGTILLFVLFPQFAILYLLVVPFLIWINHGFFAFVFTLLATSLPLLFICSLVFQSSSTAKDEQYRIFGYQREIMLVGTLANCYIAFNLGEFGWTVVANFFDVISYILLGIHLLHTVRYQSLRAKMIEANEINITNLYQSNLIFYFLIWLIPMFLRLITPDLLVLQSVFHPLAIVQWIGIIGFFKTLFKRMMQKISHS